MPRLVALDAIVHLGERQVPVDEFFLLPGATPEREHALQAGEMITAVSIPASAVAKCSTYLKVRDRASFEFAVVSVAAALRIEKAKIVDVALAAGGVGTKPWRLRASEAALTGVRPNDRTLLAAAKMASDGAQPLSRNAYKIELLPRAVFRALKDLLEEG